MLAGTPGSDASKGGAYSSSSRKVASSVQQAKSSGMAEAAGNGGSSTPRTVQTQLKFTGGRMEVVSTARSDSPKKPKKKKKLNISAEEEKLLRKQVKVGIFRSFKRCRDAFDLICLCIERGSRNLWVPSP